MSIINLSPAQLRKAADLQEKIAKLKSQLAAILGSESNGASNIAEKAAGKPVGKRTISAAHIAKIKAAQKKRWAKYKAEKAKAAKAGNAKAK